MRVSAVVFASAALAGAAGLGIEGVLLSVAGLAVGHSLASALGLGAFVAGWAVGAWLAGRSRLDPRRGFVLLALLVPGAAWLAGRSLFALGADGGAVAASAPLAFALLALAAVPQGAFLPWLARLRQDAGVGALLACNLAGALLGAWALGYVAVGAWGRPTALLASEATGAAAAALAALAASARAARGVATSTTRISRRAGWTVACVTLWTLGLEWLCLRLGVLWIGSQQAALVAVVACSLLALALGAALVPLVVPRDERGVLAVLALAAAASTWPVWIAPWLARAGVGGDVAIVLVLVVPTLMPLGAVVPVVHRALGGESGAKLGGLFAAEIWGALAAGPLVHWWLVPRFGVGGATAVLCSCAAIAAVAWFPARRAGASAVAGVALVAAGAASIAREPALSSPKLVDPALELRALVEDREFAVGVVDDGVIGERTLLTDQFRAAGTGRDYRYMRALGHLPVLLHPGPKRVAVAALGTGTTLGAVSLHGEIEQIDVLEISPAVVAMAPWFEAVNHGALADPRVRVLVGDARRTLALARAQYDVITMEPLLPDSPFGVYLYTREFYAVAVRALAPGGLVCQWVPPHALEPEVFDAVLDAFARSFAWSGAWLFGTQVILIGGERAPVLDSQSLNERTGGAVAEELQSLVLMGSVSIEARLVAVLGSRPAVRRSLTDADPWIAFREKPTGIAVLEWLPDNLEGLLAVGGELQVHPYTDEGIGVAQAFADIHRARVEHARAETDLRAGRSDLAAARARSLAPLQARPRNSAMGRESDAFRDEIEFLYSVRLGVGALQSGDAERALDPLLLATKLRPERGDVHVYLAAARARLGLDDGARTSLAKARELCPRILETPAGLRALELGLRE